MRLHQVIEVTWLDSGGSNVMWEFKDDYEEGVPRIRTVGFFVKYEAGILYVAQSMSEDQYGRMLRIPRGVIKRIREK